MEKITEGRTARKATPAMVQKFKLDAQFELMARFNIKKGCVCKVTRPVQGRTRIEEVPIPDTLAETETAFMDFHADDLCMYAGPAFDYWTGHLFLKFVNEDRVLYYDYWQHQAGDMSFGEIFQEVAAPTGTYGIGT